MKTPNFWAWGTNSPLYFRRIGGGVSSDFIFRWLCEFFLVLSIKIAKCFSAPAVGASDNLVMALVRDMHKLKFFVSLHVCDFVLFTVNGACELQSKMIVVVQITQSSGSYIESVPLRLPGRETNNCIFAKELGN